MMVFFIVSMRKGMADPYSDTHGIRIESGGQEFMPRVTSPTRPLASRAVCYKH